MLLEIVSFVIVAASGSYPNNKVTPEGTIEPGLPWCPRALKGGSLYLDLIGYINKHIKETGDWLLLKNCLTEGKADKETNTIWT